MPVGRGIGGSADGEEPGGVANGAVPLQMNTPLVAAPSEGTSVRRRPWNGTLHCLLVPQCSAFLPLIESPRGTVIGILQCILCLSPLGAR